MTGQVQVVRFERPIGLLSVAAMERRDELVFGTYADALVGLWSVPSLSDAVARPYWLEVSYP